MQFSLLQFGANGARGQIALGSLGNETPGPEDDLKPIIIDLNENVAHERVRGFFYDAAELLIASISGCVPKRKK